MAVDSHQRVHHEGDEAQVLFLRLAGGHQQDASVRAQRPVVVLARAVDALEGLLVQQDAEAVRAGHLAHQRHDEHVVVHGQVAFLEDGCQLKLVGSHLVVARLQRDAQLQCLDFQVFHEGGHAGGDGAEVVVLQLLALRSLVPHQRAARQQQVGTGGIETLVHQEVLLLPAQVGHHLLHLRVEVVADVRCGLVHGTQGFQQGRLVVQRLAGVGNEDGGDAQRVVHHEDGRRGVPRTVSACLERVADAAVGEAGRIRFLLHEQLAGELLHHAALAVVFHEGIVLLGRALGQGLEPMGVVRGAQFHGPTLHALSHLVGHVAVQGCPVVHGIRQAGIDIGGQVLEHLLAVEHIFPEILAGAFRRDGNFHGLCLERLFHYAES